MHRRSITCLPAVLLLSLVVPAVAAQSTVPYHGVLMKDGSKYTGPAAMKFAIIDQGAVLWSNDSFDGTDQPKSAVSVALSQGAFDVSLGSISMAPFDAASLKAHPGSILRVWVSTGGPFVQLADQPILNGPRTTAGGVTSVLTNEETIPLALPADEALTEPSGPGGSPGVVWSLTGNRSTDPAVNFLGTTDNTPLIFKTNSTPVMTLTNKGTVQVEQNLQVYGTAAFNSDVSVHGSLTAAGAFHLLGPLVLSGDVAIGGSLSVAHNLGIGTTTPEFPLDIVDTQAYARLASTDTQEGSILELSNSTLSGPDLPTPALGAVNFTDGSSLQGQVAYVTDNGLSFRSGGATRLTIATNGGLVIPDANTSGTSPAFTVEMTAANTSDFGAGAGLTLDHPLLNNDPTAVPYLTCNGRFSNGTVFFPVRMASLVYIPGVNRWVIVQSKESGTAASALYGLKYSVFVVTSGLAGQNAAIRQTSARAPVVPVSEVHVMAIE